MVFQVVPPVVREVGNGHEIDVDFLHSLKIYLEHFDKFTLACPVRRGNIVGSGLEKCVPLRELPWGAERFEFIPLPLTYSPTEFLKLLPSVRKKLAAEVEKADYLIFTPYSLIGDWPTIAIREAVKRDRRYVIEADGVHADVTRKRFTSKTAWKRLIQEQVLFPLFDISYRYCLKHSALGIFQGKDVFDAYAPFCSNPHKLNHHIPVYAGDHITEEQLDSKLSKIGEGDVLKICYAGRAIDMKGPLDWVDTLHELAARGVRFEATWLGDGPLLDEMTRRVAEWKIPGVILRGFVGEREDMLREIRQAHIFMFCHNTLESARILGEALACGAPLVGFGSAYPVDLVAEHGGGLFCQTHDIKGLADIIQNLDSDRSRLARLVADAARSGQEFDRDLALNRRALMVKAHPAAALSMISANP